MRLMGGGNLNVDNETMVKDGGIHIEHGCDRKNLNIKAKVSIPPKYF